MATYVIQSPDTLEYLTPDGDYAYGLEFAQTYSTPDAADAALLADNDQVRQVVYVVADDKGYWVADVGNDSYGATDDEDVAMAFATRGGAYALIALLEAEWYGISDDATYTGPFVVEEMVV